MATKSLASDGAWDTAGIWSPSGEPTIDDDVTVPAGRKFTPPASGEVQFKTLTINGDAEINTDVAIKAGGFILIGATGQIYRSAGSPIQRRFYCATSGGRYQMRMARSDTDQRNIELGGYRFEGIMPTISAEGSGGIYGDLATLIFNDDAQGDYYLGEQGLPSLGAELEEQLSEGVGSNYATWRSGQVRSFKVQLKWPKIAAGGSSPYTLDYYEVLRRMRASPYTVLVTCPYQVFRGYIESAMPARVEGGRHHGATVTIVEGRDR